MLQMQHDEIKFVKKRIYQDLESQFDQSWKSFEYFMQNILYVIVVWVEILCAGSSLSRT